MLHCPLPPPIPTPHPDHPHYSQVIQTCLELHTCVFFVWKPRMGGKSNQVLARARHALEMGIRQSLDRFHSFFFFFFLLPRSFNTNHLVFIKHPKCVCIHILCVKHQKKKKNLLQSLLFCSEFVIVIYAMPSPVSYII